MTGILDLNNKNKSKRIHSGDILVWASSMKGIGRLTTNANNIRWGRANVIQKAYLFPSSTKFSFPLRIWYTFLWNFSEIRRKIRGEGKESRSKMPAFGVTFGAPISFRSTKCLIVEYFFSVCTVIKIRTCGYPLPTWCDFAFKSVNMNQNTISIDDDEKHSQYVGATHMDHTLFATRKKSTHTHSHTHE